MNRKYNKSFLIAFGSLVVFILLLVGVISSNFGWLDESVEKIIIRKDFLTNIMKGITFLGEGSSLIVIGVLSIIFMKDKKDGVALLCGLAGIAGLNSVMKKIVQRSRPSIINHLVEASGYSFPSGHSASSMFFYGFLIYIIYSKCENKIVRNTLIVMLSILIFLIGVSRIYLGVHYPSDVLGGFTFALCYLILYIKFSKKLWGAR